MSDFEIFPVPLRPGTAAVAPLPGRHGNYATDIAQLINWAPALVITLTTQGELDAVGAQSIGQDLDRAGIAWVHFPVADFGVPDADQNLRWSAVSDQARAHLASDRRVLAHCYGGQGRSGMVVLRLMVEQGWNANTALAALRDVRPKAVETDEQMNWAWSKHP